MKRDLLVFRCTLAVLTVLMFATIQGCAVGPDFVEPKVELADSFIEATPNAFTMKPITKELWRSLGEAELDALIELALVRNTTVAQALAALNETRALSGLILYSWFPTVGIVIDGERSQP